MADDAIQLIPESTGPHLKGSSGKYMNASQKSLITYREDVWYDF